MEGWQMRMGTCEVVDEMRCKAGPEASPQQGCRKDGEARGLVPFHFGWLCSSFARAKVVGPRRLGRGAAAAAR